MDEAGDKEAVLESQRLESVLYEGHRSSEKSEPSEHFQVASISQQSFQIRPQADAKFRPSAVQELLHSVLSEALSDKKYSDENSETWAKTIANTIRNRIKDKEFKRYKLIVEVVLGEKHGAGVKVGARCLWDADTDNYVSASYSNETLFCVAAVFAVYMY